MAKERPDEETAAACFPLPPLPPSNIQYCRRAAFSFIRPKPPRRLPARAVVTSAACTPCSLLTDLQVRSDFHCLDLCSYPMYETIPHQISLAFNSILKDQFSMHNIKQFPITTER